MLGDASHFFVKKYWHQQPQNFRVVGLLYYMCKLPTTQYFLGIGEMYLLSNIMIDPKSIALSTWLFLHLAEKVGFEPTFCLLKTHLVFPKIF